MVPSLCVTTLLPSICPNKTPPLSAHHDRHLDSIQQEPEYPDTVSFSTQHTNLACGSRPSSRFDQQGPEESHLKLETEDMEEPVSGTPRVPDQTSRALDSQASHLCQACLSALTMDDLEVGRIYPHHSSVRSLLDAHRRRCYLCSPRLRSMRDENLEILQLLAEGKMPDPTDGSSSLPTHGDLSSACNTRDEIRRLWIDGVRKDGFVSLTGLSIKSHDDYIMWIEIRLNPDYDAALPGGINLYEAHPSTWMEVMAALWYLKRTFIITGKGPSGPSNWLRTRQRMTDS